MKKQFVQITYIVLNEDSDGYERAVETRNFGTLEPTEEQITEYVLKEIEDTRWLKYKPWVEIQVDVVSEEEKLVYVETGRKKLFSKQIPGKYD